MMGKPSMFSKNYEKSMKRRKKRILITIIIICILIISVLTYIFFNNGKIFKFISNSEDKITSIKSSNTINNEGKMNQKSNEVKSSKNKVQDSMGKDEYFKVTINGVNIKVIYEVKDGNKLIKEVKDLPNEDMYYEISPTKKAILVYQQNMQKMFYVDDEGSIKDISKEKYVSSKGTIFKRKNIIENNKDYVWCEKARFINDNVIAFVSELPWVGGKNNKFIWFGNIQSMNYKYVRNKNGKDIEFKSLTDKGLETQIDGDTYYIDENGRVRK
ncbi:hypothetical protein ACFIJ5_05220 [Haloimpatiens sp. FM7330]|uniref:hypothetical protein n=1 Tax=Haloimpatiens sp. FM7330 TaxID=3298610 RepID=UPI003635D51E